MPLGMIGPHNPQQHVGNEIGADTLKEGLFGEVGKHLTHGELLDTLGNYSDAESQKAIQASGKLRSVEGLVGIAHIGRAARKWYRQAAEVMKNRFGEKDAARFVALVAATSPSKSVRKNMQQASFIWKHYVAMRKEVKKQGRDLNIKDIHKFVDDLNHKVWEGGQDLKYVRGSLSRQGAALPPQNPQFGKPGKPTKKFVGPPGPQRFITKPGSDSGNVIKALDPRSDPADTTVKLLSRPSSYKVDMFRKNMLGELMGAITNDTWIAKALGTGRSAPGGPEYHINSAQVRAVTDAVNKKRPKDDQWSHADTQAAIWQGYKMVAGIQHLSRMEGPAREQWQAEHPEFPIPEGPIGAWEAVRFLTNAHTESTANVANLLHADPLVKENLKGIPKPRTYDPKYEEGLEQEYPSEEPVTKGLSTKTKKEMLPIINTTTQESFTKAHRQMGKHGVLKRFAADGSTPPPPMGVKIPGTEPRQEPTSSVAVSPNIQQGLSLEQANERRSSANYKAFEKITKGMAESLGVKSKTHSAIGAWKDGAEDSIYQELAHETDPATVKYLAAWYGLTGKQKQVYFFHFNPSGPDSQYKLDLPAHVPMREVHELLLKNGINFHTLLPGTDKTTVVIGDQNRSLRANVQKLAGDLHAAVSESTGQLFSLGDPAGEDSAKARKHYWETINAYEAGKDPGSVQKERKALLGDMGRAAESGTLGYSKGGPRIRFSGVQSPQGGVMVRGMYYQGGKFIPRSQLEKSSWPQFEAVESRRNQLYNKPRQYRRADGSVPTAGKMIDVDTSSRTEPLTSLSTTRPIRKTYSKTCGTCTEKPIRYAEGEESLELGRFSGPGLRDLKENPAPTTEQALQEGGLMRPRGKYHTDAAGRPVVPPVPSRKPKKPYGELPVTEQVEDTGKKPEDETPTPSGSNSTQDTWGIYQDFMEEHEDKLAYDPSLRQQGGHLLLDSLLEQGPFAADNRYLDADDQITRVVKGGVTLPKTITKQEAAKIYDQWVIAHKMEAYINSRETPYGSTNAEEDKLQDQWEAKERVLNELIYRYEIAHMRGLHVLADENVSAANNYLHGMSMSRGQDQEPYLQNLRALGLPV